MGPDAARDQGIHLREKAWNLIRPLLRDQSLSKRVGAAGDFNGDRFSKVRYIPTHGVARTLADYLSILCCHPVEETLTWLSAWLREASDEVACLGRRCCVQFQRVVGVAG
jgi:hypothetical protein